MKIITLPKKSKNKSGQKSKPDQNLIDYCLRLLSYRPRTQSEIAFRLKRKKIDPKTIAHLLSHFKSLKLLDDSEFAAWWQIQRDRFKPRSFKVLRLELIKKGVPKDIISQVLNTSFDHEIKRIKQALSQKFKLKSLPSDQKTRLKVLRFLTSRGFSWEHIRQLDSNH